MARIVVVVAAALALTDFAADAAKKPWELTIDERIAARTSPAVVASHSKNAQSSSPEAPFVLRGGSDAYLFMPSELFAWLLGGVDANTKFREGTRSMIADDLKPFGYEETSFWSTITTASKTYTSLRAQQSQLTKRSAVADPQQQRAIRTELDNVSAKLCAARAAALQCARRQLGARFDEFLYTAVAPHLTLGTVTPDATTAERLRKIEGGCR